MWIDAHSHLDRYDLMEGRHLDAALAEIVQHRIFTVSNSMDLPSYKRNVDIGKTCGWVLPAFGVHPWNAPDYAGRLSDLNEAMERCLLIGEIGLDHHFVDDDSAYPAQRKVFEYFLAAARERKKTVSLHTKGAEKDVLKLLNQYHVRRVIVHWYSGPLDIFREFASRGALFTVGIEALHSRHVRAIAEEIPSDRLLTETDNPGGPHGFLGEFGTPVLIKEIIRGLAEIRQTSAEDLARTVQSNMAALVREDPRMAVLYGNVLEENSGPA